MLDIVNDTIKNIPMNAHTRFDPTHRQDEHTHIFREIMRTQQALIQHFSREMSIPASRLALMRVLALAHPEGIGTNDISRHLGVNAAAVTRHIKELEAEGLVVRRDTRHDARLRHVALSPGGLELFHELHAKSHVLEEESCAGLDVEELKTCVKVLSSIRKNITEKRDRRF